MTGRTLIMTAAGLCLLAGQALASASLAPASGDMAQQSTNTLSGNYIFKLDGKWRLQFDGLAGRSHHDDIYFLGEHMFWRDKKIGLAGLYTSYAHYSRSLSDARYGVQAVSYFMHANLEAQAGYEEDNFDNGFYDVADAAYYPDPNGRLFLGHRHTHGTDAGAVGGEFLMPLAGVAAAPFAEGRAGDKSQTGFWVGIRFYFGDDGQTLEDIHEDGDAPGDPIDSIFNPDLGHPGPQLHNAPPCPNYIAGASLLVALLQDALQ